MFLFVVPIIIWSRIACSSALQSLLHSKKVHVFPAASTPLQKGLKVSFLTWTNCLNSRFRIIGFSVGLYRNFVRKWSHVQTLDRTSFGSAAFQSWISLVVAKNPRSFFTLSFDIHVFFINSIFVSAGSFFFVAVYFVIEASIACFGRSGYCASYQNSYFSMNWLKAFKVAFANRSGLNCKFSIPRGVVAVSNSILYPRRHILIRSYNERKLQQGVKKTSFLIFSYFSFASQKNIVCSS